MKAAAETDGEVLPKGEVNQHTSKKVEQIAQPQGERARVSGVGRRTQQKLDRLARDFPDLHSKVCPAVRTAAGAFSLRPHRLTLSRQKEGTSP
jgi:hypothetical protein